MFFLAAVDTGVCGRIGNLAKEDVMAGEMGARIGLDEVAGKLGTGGMSEVYRAHDTTLDRDVARKLLPEPFTANPDRLTRFQREFRGHWVAASLERRL